MWRLFRVFVMMIVIAVMSVSMVAAPALAAAEGDDTREYGAEAMIFDTVFLRPFGIIATVFGSAVFVVSLPFSLAGGNTSKAAEKLVVDPFEYTFKRPLGQIDPME